MKFKKAGVDLSATLIRDTNKIPLKNLISKVKATIEEEKLNGNITDNMSLIGIVNHCYPIIQINIYEEYFVKCLIIYQLYEE